MKYRPVPTPAPSQQYLDAELRRLVQTTAVAPAVTLDELNAEPSKIEDGQIVYADGTNWNPGDGEGVYARVGGAWQTLVGVQPDEAETITGEWVIGGVSASNLLDKTATESISGAYTFSNNVLFTRSSVSGLNGSTINIFNSNPQVSIYDTGAATDEGVWNLIASNNYFELRTLTDTYDAPGSVIKFNRGTGTAVTDATFGTQITVDKGGGQSILIKDNVAGGNAYNAWIQWQDSSNVDQGYIGFGSASNETFYINNQSGGDILLNTSGDVDISCGVTGAVEITGSSYKTYPTGMRLGQYTSSIGYIQTPGSTGRIDIWNGATGAIAEFQYNYIRFNQDADMRSGRVFFCSDSTNSDYIAMRDSGSLGYIYTNTNPCAVAAGNDAAARFTVGIRQDVADDAEAEFTHNGTGYGFWIVMNSYNALATAIIGCAGSGAVSVYLGTTARLGTSGTNPNVDGQANYWCDADGHLHVKNRLGSTRRFTAYHFSG